MATEIVTLEIPVDLYDKIQFLATDQHQDPVEIIIQLVTTAYEQRAQASTPAFQTLLAHAMDLGISDLSSHHDQYLHNDLNEE
jgi:hypothetical protein